MMALMPSREVASPAHPITRFSYVRVPRRELMAVDAVRLASIPSLNGFPPEHVLSSRDLLKMFRVHAAPNTTEMIDRQFGVEFSVPRGVGKSVCIDVPPLIPEAPISVVGDASLPEPATLGCASSFEKELALRGLGDFHIQSVHAREEWGYAIAG